MTTYLLDSNIFIQSHRFEYRFSFCNGFWTLLKTLHNAGTVFSIKAVKTELMQGGDALSDWVRALPNTFFLDERDVSTQEHYGYLMNWAMKNKHFTDEAKRKFASEHADPWLVAHARASNMRIVTHEVYDANIKRTIKIPNAARELGVACVNTYDFLEDLAERTFEMKIV